VRILYRVRQFWGTLSIKKDHLELEQALALLSPEQRVLFTQMQPGEQNHALIMFCRLLEQGENQPDLLVAALLHDVGKLRYPLSPLERVMVVLVKAAMPKQARRWGQLPLNGWDGLPSWRKAFIVAEHHAVWGAEMARKTGVSPLTENLIRLHHHPHRQCADAEETSLLHKLWLVDNKS
jgi:putative nucleotidyltransferase with HDIG domain